MPITATTPSRVQPPDPADHAVQCLLRPSSERGRDRGDREGVALLETVAAQRPGDLVRVISSIAARQNQDRVEYYAVLEGAGRMLAENDSPAAATLIRDVLRQEYRHPYLQIQLAMGLAERWLRGSEIQPTGLLQAALETMPSVVFRGPRAALARALSQWSNDGLQEGNDWQRRDVSDRADRLLVCLLQHTSESCGAEIVSIISDHRLQQSLVLQGYFQRELSAQLERPTTHSSAKCEDAEPSAAMLRALFTIATQPWVNPMLERFAKGDGGTYLREPARDTLRQIERAAALLRP